MSAGMLYHAMGLKGYQEVASYYDGAALVCCMEQPREDFRCSRCNQPDVHSKGTVARRFRGVPIGLTPVWIELAVPRVWCARCRVERQVRVKFADPMRRHTHAFERMVAELSHYTLNKRARFAIVAVSRRPRVDARQAAGRWGVSWHCGVDHSFRNRLFVFLRSSHLIVYDFYRSIQTPASHPHNL